MKPLLSLAVGCPLMLVTKYRSSSASYLTDSGVLNPSTVSTRVAVAAAGCCGLRPQQTARVASPRARNVRGCMCIEARVVTATPPHGLGSACEAASKAPTYPGNLDPGSPVRPAASQ